MLSPWGIIHVLAALTLAPLLLSIIQRTKAVCAGRHGPPWLQPYAELWKLLHKGAVYSHTTTVVFIAGPLVGGAATLVALFCVPLGGVPAFVSFPLDFLLVAYLLGIARFFAVSAALDTGSSFEGMGASREVFFAALAEPALVLALTALAALTHRLTLTDIFAHIDPQLFGSSAGPALLLVAAALSVVFLAENARLPVDDPATHLELTMIHEVMILDHSGPDLALIHYAAALKMWLLGCLLVGTLLPLRTGSVAGDLLIAVAGQVAVAVGVGVVESVMARLRLVRVPQFLIAASILAIVALFLVAR